MDKEKMIDLRSIAFQCATNILTATEEDFCVHSVMYEAEEIVEYILSGKINIDNEESKSEKNWN